MSDKVMYLLFYAFVLIAALVAAFLKLIPLDSVFGILAGHGGASLPTLTTSSPTSNNYIPPPAQLTTCLLAHQLLGKSLFPHKKD